MTKYCYFRCLNIQKMQMKRETRPPRIDCVNMSNRRWWWKNRCLKSIKPSPKLNHHLLRKKIFLFTRIFSIDKDGPLNIFFQHRKRISVFYVLRCNERWSTFLLLHKMFFTVMTYLSFKMNKEIFSCVYFYFGFSRIMWT